jgi:hypothetical protein
MFCTVRETQHRASLELNCQAGPTIVVTSPSNKMGQSQDHVEELLMKRKYTSAHTYKINLNALKVKILQFKV